MLVRLSDVTLSHDSGNFGMVLRLSEALPRLMRLSDAVHRGAQRQTNATDRNTRNLRWSGVRQTL